MKRRVTLLGATGSVGSSAVEVIAADPQRFQVEVVTANANIGKLAALAKRLGARQAVIAAETSLAALRDALAGSGISAAAGAAAMEEAAAVPADIVVSAIVGAAGLSTTVAAIKSGNHIALANKECLICAGGAVMALARQHDVRILPVDSEHNALFQLIEGRDRSSIRTYTITASGGPFRNWPIDRLARATPDQALAHPTWSMGAKVTIDSATLMNKGLELIEAHHLFGLSPESLNVLVHPQSIVHALVTFHDGSIHAEIGAADMRRPLSYCLYWPDRSRKAVQELDLAQIGQLSFERPDLQRFPALRLAIDALKHGNGAATVLNAANEVAVQAFLAGRLAFTAIAEIVDKSLTAASYEGLLVEPSSIAEALELDTMARRIAHRDIAAQYVAA